MVNERFKNLYNTINRIRKQISNKTRISLKVGDRVKLKNSPFGRYNGAVIKQINGSYIIIVMNYNKSEYECYPNELILDK